MSLKKEDKIALVEGVKEDLKNAQSLVIAENSGVDVISMTRLRSVARSKGVRMKVLKNTLAIQAVEGTPFEELKDRMKGPLIYAYSEDPVAAAKVLNDFAKTNAKLEIRAGFYDKLMEKDEVVALASIPGREELLGKLLGVMQAPVSGFARALAALAEQKESAA